MSEFQHRHAAHCESGVMASLVSHYGLPLSEAMAFGLGEALSFVHLPWVKMGGVPLTSYRMLPGHIIGGLQRNLGVRMVRRRFRSAGEAMAELDRVLAEHGPVGLQTSVYWLPYFPPDMRFHFNAHNLIAFDKQGERYRISDPVFEHPVECTATDLARARFVRGVFAPRGTLYYPVEVPGSVDLAAAARTAIRRTAARMVKAPVPILGVRGIRLMARNIEKLEKQTDLRYARLFVGSVIRMQEEIGTGGASFRFIFASFLQEAAELLGAPRLLELSGQATSAGDLWREFALEGARLCKREGVRNFARMGEILRECADREEVLFRELLKAP